MSPGAKMEKILLPILISTDRVTLKKHDRALADQMFEFVDQDRSRLREFLPWVDSTMTVEDEINYIEMTHIKWETYQLFDYGIYRNCDNQYMGNIGIHSIEWGHNRCEIGYWLLGRFEGQGYMTEAVLTLEKTCFEMGFNRIEIRCSATNHRSAQVPIRCGYNLEATLTQDSIERGIYRDTCIFGKVNTLAPTHKPNFVAIDFVYLFTSDLPASRLWYQLVLGIAPVVDLENYVEYRPGGRCGLCLHPADKKSPSTTGGSVSYWKVRNFDETILHFQSHGAKIYRGPLEIPGAKRICQLADPIGNVIGLIG
jgi:RimJ/RimL family protein N-acetyltransferase/predicted enzyme related to lactoylglutathione lyase